jgi:hypothetical protein
MHASYQSEATPYAQHSNPASRWQILEARPDWITLTAPTGEGATDLYDVGIPIIRSAGGRDVECREWRWQGYTGLCSRGVAWGWRLDGACLRASGMAAGLVYHAARHLKVRCTRLDLCVTARSSQPVDNLSASYYRSAGRGPTARGRRFRSTLIINDLGGQTFYAGTRTSPVYLRVYRKDIESEGEYPEYSWRWEVELKDLVSDNLWHLEDADLEDPQKVKLLVASYFARWHLDVPWLDATPDPVWVPRREPTDAERLERWLRTSVAPAIERLMTCRTRAEILDALGLNPDVPASHT